MARSQSRKAPLQSTDTETVDRVAALEAENRKLHERIVTLEVQDFSSQARITELEKALKEALEKPGFQLLIQGLHPPEGQ